MKDFSYITNSSPQFVENLYNDYLKDPESVDPELKKFFEGFDFALSTVAPTNGGAVKVKPGEKPAAADIDWKAEINAYRLILGYRNKAHLIAKTNPIRPRRDRGANLELSFFGFTEDDLDKTFYAGNLIGLGRTSLRKIVEYLKNCYASNVGIEFKYISDQKKVDFITKEVEKNFLNPLPIEKRNRILDKL